MLDIRKEIEFWSLIMRDHALFQFTSLSPKETETIKTAKYFMNLFENYYREIKTNPIEMNNIINNNKNSLNQFIQFKKMMLTKLMNCEIELAMSPSFLNHMINEALEYYQVLSYADGTVRFNHTLEMLRLHKIWLPDASGHTKFIVSQLDGIELCYIDEALVFMERFDKLFKKAFELFLIFEKTGLENGSMLQFNREVEKTLEEFVKFLDMIEKLRKNCVIYATGTFSPLIPNHMLREEKYYLYRIKLLEGSN